MTNILHALGWGIGAYIVTIVTMALLLALAGATPLDKKTTGGVFFTGVCVALAVFLIQL